MESSLLIHRSASEDSDSETLPKDGDCAKLCVEQACQSQLLEGIQQLDDDDFSDITETEIESNFISYRCYIESCIKTIDLLVFFKLFTAEQTKTLYKLSKSDPVKATRKAFDIIVDMQTASNKFHHLLCALKEAETEAADALGIDYRVGGSSCAVSIKGLKKQLANKTSLTGREMKQLEFIRSVESMKKPSSMSTSCSKKTEEPQERDNARIPDTSDDLKTMTRLKKKLTIPKLIFNSTTKSVILAKEIMLMCLRRFFVSSVAKIFVKLVKKFTEDFDRLKTTGPQTVMKKERK